MAHPKLLNLERAQVIRELLAEGSRRSDLARAFQCSEGLIRDVVMGKIYRYRPCDGCGAAISPQRTSGLCPGCKDQVCVACQAPKSPHRKSQRCAACDRQRMDRLIQQQDYHCRECGVEFPPTRKDRLCSDCRREATLIYQQFRQARNKRLACRHCGGALPQVKSWTRNLCRECAREHDRLRRSLSRRLCGLCGKTLPDTEKHAMCAACRAEERRMKRRGTLQTPEELAQMIERRGSRSWDPPAVDGCGGGPPG
jgi:hypothetical protein